jgi:hypothetical protein
MVFMMRPFKGCESGAKKTPHRVEPGGVKVLEAPEEKKRERGGRN